MYPCLRGLTVVRMTEGGRFPGPSLVLLLCGKKVKSEVNSMFKFEWRKELDFVAKVSEV